MFTKQPKRREYRQPYRRIKKIVKYAAIGTAISYVALTGCTSEHKSENTGFEPDGTKIHRDFTPY